MPALEPCLAGLDLDRHLGAVAQVLQPSVRVSNLYPVLLGAFQALAAGQGRMGLHEFVMRTAGRESFGRHLMTSARSDALGRPSGLGFGAPLSGLGTIAPPTFTMFFQPVGNGEEPPSVVVNRINQGPGGLMIRWGKIPALEERARSLLMPWLQSLHPGCRVVGATAGDSWADVQSLPDGVVEVLGWPTQNPGLYRRHRVLAADRIDVVLDRESGSLQLEVRKTGQPVAIPYLGVVPQHLLRGVGKILQVLTDPWIYDFRLGLEDASRLAPPAAAVVERLERQSRDGVVLRRRTWKVPSSCVPFVSHSAGAIGDEALIRSFHTWRSAEELPRRVFVRAGLPRRLGTQHDKPQFVDFADPLTLDLLVLAARANPWVTLEEALPDQDSAWWPNPDQAARVMELTAAFAIGEAAGRSR